MIRLPVFFMLLLCSICYCYVIDCLSLFTPLLFSLLARARWGWARSQIARFIIHVQVLLSSQQPVFRTDRQPQWHFSWHVYMSLVLCHNLKCRLLKLLLDHPMRNVSVRSTTKRVVGCFLWARSLARARVPKSVGEGKLPPTRWRPMRWGALTVNIAFPRASHAHAQCRHARLRKTDRTARPLFSDHSKRLHLSEVHSVPPRSKPNRMHPRGIPPSVQRCAYITTRI